MNTGISSVMALGLTLVSIGSISCGGDAEVEAAGPATRDSAGVAIRVEAIDSSRSIASAEEFRIGAVDGPEELQFSRIRGLEVVPQRGEVFVLDADQVKVFTLDGTYLRTIGRRGDGPGEFMKAATLRVARDTLMVTDRRSVHVFTAEGEHLASTVVTVPGDITFPGRVVAHPSGWSIEAQNVSRTTGANVLGLYALDVAEGPTGDPVFTHDFTENSRTGVGSMGWIVEPLLSHQKAWAYDKSGRIYVAPTGDYEIRVLDQQGGVARIHRYETKRVPVEQQMVESYRARYEERCREYGAGSESCLFLEEAMPIVLGMDTPEFVPVVQRLYASDEGALLVLRRDLDPNLFEGGDPATYDMMDGEGAHLGRFNPPDRFTPLWFDDDELWGYQRDELDVQYVVKLRLTP